MFLFVSDLFHAFFVCRCPYLEKVRGYGEVILFVGAGFQNASCIDPSGCVASLTSQDNNPDMFSLHQAIVRLNGQVATSLPEGSDPIASVQVALYKFEDVPEVDHFAARVTAKVMEEEMSLTARLAKHVKPPTVVKLAFGLSYSVGAKAQCWYDLWKHSPHVVCLRT